MWRFALKSGYIRGAAVIGGVCLHACQVAHNAGANIRDVASFSTSGLIFKDSLKLYSLTDPKVEGVTIYLSDSEYNTIDKVKNFLSDPSSASLTCVQTGPIKIHPDAKFSSEGEDIYEETRNMFFKVRY
jgi:catabolite regulation protein CreA